MLILLALITALAAFFALEFFTFRTPRIHTPLSAGKQSISIATVQTWLQQLEERGKFNGSILYQRQGEILLQSHHGFTDSSQSQVISEHTSFNLASISKHITAYAILLLEHQKKLELDAPITRYLPELKGYANTRLQHLIYNTSGIPDYVNLANKHLANGELFTNEHLLQWMIKGQMPSKFSAGEQELYSNSDYILLAEIISRVSGLNYGDFIQGEIFTPLGLKNSAVVTQTYQSFPLPQRAYGFAKRFIYFGNNTDRDLNQLDGCAGDGNIYMSALDLIKWHQAIQQGKLLPAELYAKAYAPLQLNSGRTATSTVWGRHIHSGMGWCVEQYPKVYSYGCWQGFSNYFCRDVERDEVLIVLSNSGFFLRTASIIEQLESALSRI